MHATGRTVFMAPGLLRRLVSRPALVDRIEHATQHPVTVVRGASGTGKSALIGEWAHSRVDSSTPAVWIAVDATNAGRLAFWTSLVDTLVAAGHAPVGSLLADTVLADGDPSAVRLTLLRGMQQLATPVLVVIDDFHALRDAAVADDLLWLLEHGDRLRLLIATRTVSEFESPTAAARFAPTVITDDDLAFRFDETRRSVAEAGLDLDDTEIAALHTHVAGWPLGVRLLIVELEGRAGAADQFSAVAAANAVISRSSGRLIASLAESGHLDLLLRTSVAERLTDDLLRLLAPDSATAGVLDWMELEGLGSRDDAGRFRHHPLVRSALETEFVRQHPADAVAQRRVLARWANDNDDVATAIIQSALAGDWDHLSAVVKRHFGSIVRLYTSEMQSALDAVPGGTLRRSPVLVTMLALLLNARDSTAGQRLRALTTVAIGLTRDRLAKDTSPERMWLLICAMAVERVAGLHDRAARTAEAIAAYLPDFALDSAAHLERTLSTVQLQVATSYFYVGRHREASALLREVAPAAPPWGAVHALSIDALILAMRGDMVATDNALRPLRERQAPTGWRGTYSATGYHLAEAMLHLENFDIAAAKREVAALDRHRPTIEHWPLLLRLDGLIALAEGDGFGGAQRLAAAVAQRKISSTSSAMAALIASSRADLLLAAGQTQRAKRLLSVSGLPAREIGLSLARVALAEGLSARAIELVEPYIWAEADMPRARAEALLLSAIARSRLGDASGARAALERALELMNDARLRRPFMMVPRGELIALMRALGDWRGEPADSLLDGVPVAFGDVAVIAPLSAREQDVLAALASTPSAAEIAAELFVSTNTVKSQLRSVYRKLGVSSRDEALRVASDRGLLRRVR